MNARRMFIPGFLAAGAALLFAGCDRGANVTDAGAEGDGTGVTFTESHGLRFSPEVLRMLSLETAEVAERPLAGELRATAQVFATTPRVLARAHVSGTQVAAFEKASAPGVKLLRADRPASEATRLVELVFGLEDATPPPEIGGFVELTLTLPPVTVPAVPRSAVLDGAVETFVYVVNGGAYLRTPVRLGMRSAEYVEITGGLHPGDVVVTTLVEQLWLTELRLTKGAYGG